MSLPLSPGKINAVDKCARSIRSSDSKQLPQVTQLEPESVLHDCSTLVSFYFQTIQRGGHIGC